MALRIGLPRSSALQNDGLDVPVILQCRTPRETNPKGHWGAKILFHQILVFSSSLYPVLVYPVLRSLEGCAAHRTAMAARVLPRRLAAAALQLCPEGASVDGHGARHGMAPHLRDRKTGYTKTEYREEAKTRNL